MTIKYTDRTTLKGYFVKNAIPTAGNFAQLIDSALNQRDDGIVKLPGNPLSIEADGQATGPQKVLSFYRDLDADANPAWGLSLNAYAEKGNALSARPGLTVSDGAGMHRFHIQEGTGQVGLGLLDPSGTLDVARGSGQGGTAVFRGTERRSHFNHATDEHTYIRGGKFTSHVFINDSGGNVAVGSTTAEFKLDVSGSVRMGGFSTDESDQWPNVIWLRDTAKGWDEGLVKASRGRDTKFKRPGFGIHMHSSRRFSFFSTGWDELYHLEGGTGKSWQKGSLDVGGLIVERNLGGHLNMDGALYRTGGQVYLTVDDNLYVRDTDGQSRFHFNTNNGTLTATRIEATIDQRHISSPHIVAGMIIMWSGAANAIPSGWALCNGTNGTPNLQGRFIVGYGGGYGMNQTGGAAQVTLTNDQMPRHRHAYYTWQDDFNVSGGSNKNHPGFGVDNGSRRTWHTDYEGGGKPHENRPPYFVLAFIMKL